MSALVAVVNRKGGPVTREQIGAMLASCAERAVDGEHIEVSQSIGLAHQHFWLTPEEVGEVQPKTHPCGLSVCCDARLDDREALAAHLDIDGASSTDADLILVAYLKWGAQCPNHLLGDFAFVIWDPAKKALFGARDPLGVRDLCYCDRHDVLLVASHINHILGYPGFERRADDERIARLLMNDWSDQQSSFWSGVKYLPPACAFLFIGDEFKSWRYWRPSIEPRPRRRDPREFTEEFRSLLDAAVRNRLRVHGEYALSLSGGPDSACLAALLVEHGGSKHLKTFSYVFERFKGCDESGYIRQLVNTLNLDAEYLPGDELGPLSDIGSWPVAPDFAGQDPYVRLARAVQQAARDKGCRTLFHGHYSDVLFAGGRLRVAECLSQGRFFELFRRDIAASEVLGGLRQSAPAALKRIYRSFIGAHHDPMIPLGPALQFAPAPAVPEWSGCRSPSAAKLQQLKQILRSTEPQAVSSSRVPTNANAVEYIDPYWDTRLIEFILQVPMDLLLRDGYKKWLLRKAMQDRVVCSVLWRKSKTSLLELFTHGLTEAEDFLSNELLHRPQIVDRGYVPRQWLTRQVNSAPHWTDHGYPLWLCIGLELWLTHCA